MDGEELSILLSIRCSRYVRRVEAEFVPKKDFWYGWSVRDGVATVRICDYMDDAPLDVICDFGEMILRRAMRLRWSTPESFMRFVSTDEFVNTRRPVFVRRSRNLLRTDIGDHAFIPDSVQRLLDCGLLTADDIDNSWFSWTRRESVRRLGFCATMFRVVGISKALDSPDVPDEVLDYVVYHECLHLRQGYRPNRSSHDAEFRSWERAYPGWEECERALRSLGDLRRRGRALGTDAPDSILSYCK